MSSNVTENDSFPTTVPAPDVGDTTYPAVVADAIDRLADRTRHHENTLTGNYIGTAYDILTIPATLTQFVFHPENRLGALNPFTTIAKSLFQNFKWLKESIPGKAKGVKNIAFHPGSPVNAHAANFGWESVWASNIISLVQANNASTDIAYFQLPIFIREGTLTAVRAQVLGSVAGGNPHGSNLPAAMPRIDLYRYIATGGGVAAGLVGGQVDTAATGAAYDAAHTIQLTGLNENIAASATLFWLLKVTGESGANSIADSFAIQRLDFDQDGGSL